MVLGNSVSDLFVIPSGMMTFELNATARVNASTVLGLLSPACSKAIKQFYECPLPSTSRMPPH